MGVKAEEKYIYKTESSWSSGDNPLLCLNTGDWRTERPVVNTENAIFAVSV
jgi:hypothetical protein